MWVPVLLWASAVSAAPVPSQVELDRLFAPVDRPGSPGCVVDVRRAGAVLAQRRYGLADLEGGRRIEADTVFEAGSVSKQVVGALLALLAERGALSLDDSIRRWLPELPPPYQPVTVAMLLHHTSGIRDWSDLAALSGWPRGTRAYDMDDALALVARQRALNFAAGSEYLYSNSNYVLAARIAERAGGDSLQALSQALLFAPLGMGHTRWRTDYRSVVPGRAQAYAQDEDGQWRLDMPFERVVGPGGLLTTVGDLQRWNAALDAGGVGWRARMAQPGTLGDGTRVAYGLGLELARVNGRAAISHAGATAGYRAWLGRVPELRLSVALLCNAGSINTEDLGPEVAALFMPPAPPVTARAAAAPLAGDLAGRYRNVATDAMIEVRRAGAALSLGGHAYVSVAPDRLVAEDGRSLQVERGPAGAVAALRIDRPGNRPLRLEPAPLWQPDAGQLAAAAGRYRSAELGSELVLRVDDGQLVWVDPRGARTVLQATSTDTFRAPGWNLRLQRDALGRPCGLRMSSGRVRQLGFARQPD